MHRRLGDIEDYRYISLGNYRKLGKHRKLGRHKSIDDLTDA